MPPDKFAAKGRNVPSGRFERMLRFGGMATGIAGGMMLDGVMQLATGKRPTIGELLMTPANALKVTLQLGQMRGAAMKLGQMISMDAGDLLPPELSDILGRLRADAQHMPQEQLDIVLAKNWGKGWRSRFSNFEDVPIAAASIGQVHRATTIDGRDVAIKVQYPGVRKSIDSDVDNVATLLRLSNLLPQSLDIGPVLEETKRQLHEEADYIREGDYLQRFHDLLADDADYVVPIYHADYSTAEVLAMSYISGVQIETLADKPAEERDRAAALLIDLVLRELFEFGVMQTDPNFANYRFNPETRQLILLDFGAARVLENEVVQHYRTLLKHALAGDYDAVFKAALAIGFFNDHTAKSHKTDIENMLTLALDMLSGDEPFDFGNSEIVGQMRDQGMDIAADRRNWHVPPVGTLFVQRKLGGVYLLASKLKAKVHVRKIMQNYI
jgi:predicted unusual protein kinase regulating ubiquinone biosynthesis (AarF/ABC1/UbiB family)